jgi:thiamine-phosphate pyrophosphorylase
VDVPQLHVVTDDVVVARPDFLRRAGEILRLCGGGVALHLRAPAMAGRRQFDLAVSLRAAADGTGGRVLINDRIDVAMAAGTDGVQLGSRSIAPADARPLLSRRALIGASVHSGAEAASLAGEVDFFLAGTIYASASHPDRAGAGPARVREVAASGRPCIAIGGIRVDRIPILAAAGASGIAVIRAVWDAPEPRRAAIELLERWKQVSNPSVTPSV